MGVKISIVSHIGGRGRKSSCCHSLVFAFTQARFRPEA
jgi:hypothetical protein